MFNEFDHFFNKKEYIQEAVLRSKDRDDLNDSEFGIPELRKYPLTDEDHVRAAVRMFPHAPFKYRKSLAKRILRRAKELNIDTSEWTSLNNYVEYTTDDMNDNDIVITANFVESYEYKQMLLEQAEMLNAIDEEIFIENGDRKGKSFLRKIFDAIVSALKYIKNQIGKIIDKIKSLFTKKKKNDINSIAEETFGDSVVKEYAIFQEGTQKGVDYLTAHGVDPVKFADDIYISLKGNDTITIELGKSGKEVYHANAPMTSRIYQSNKGTFKFKTIKDKKDMVRSNTNLQDVRKDFDHVIFTIKRLNLLKNVYEDFKDLEAEMESSNGPTSMLSRMFDFGKSSAFLALEESFNDYNKKLEKAYSDKTVFNNSSIDITIKELTDTQAIVSKILMSVDKIRTNVNADISSDLNSKIFNLLTIMSHTFTNLQMSFNSFSHQINFDMNFISPKYRNKVKSIEKIAEFTSKCIDKGIPPKYISYNVWLLASKSLKGKDKDYMPVKGQSRFVLFPEDKSVVYKVAMSGFGVAANNNEEVITKLVKNEDSIRKYFALIEENYSDGAIVKQERMHDFDSMLKVLPVNVRKSSSSEMLKNSPSSVEIQETLDKIQATLNLPNKFIVNDLHEANFIMDSNRRHIVLLDYGMLVPNNTINNVLYHLRNKKKISTTAKEK